jgi:hypothetical protein
MAEPHLAPARYEQQDVVFPWLAAGLGGVLFVVFLCALFVFLFYPLASVDRRVSAALPTYPTPRLQVDVSGDLKKLRDSKLAQLNSSGWVDQAHGVAHIPISDAMKLIAERGIPDWPKPQK